MESYRAAADSLDRTLKYLRATANEGTGKADLAPGRIHRESNLWRKVVWRYFPFRPQFTPVDGLIYGSMEDFEPVAKADLDRYIRNYCNWLSEYQASPTDHSASFVSSTLGAFQETMRRLDEWLRINLVPEVEYLARHKAYDPDSHILTDLIEDIMALSEYVHNRIDAQVPNCPYPVGGEPVKPLD